MDHGSWIRDDCTEEEAMDHGSEMIVQKKKLMNLPVPVGGLVVPTAEKEEKYDQTSEMIEQKKKQMYMPALGGFPVPTAEKKEKYGQRSEIRGRKPFAFPLRVNSFAFPLGVNSLGEESDKYGRALKKILMKNHVPAPEVGDLGEKEVKCVYLCLNTGKNQTCKWYSIKNKRFSSGRRNWNAGRLELKEATVVSGMEKHPNYKFYGCGVAVWESNIYFIGGIEGIDKSPYPRVHKEVHIFDTNTRKWTEGTQMMQARSYAKAIAVSGKIYVFGSDRNRWLTIDLWAQYYDINSGTWNPLPPPPEELYKGAYIDSYAVHARGNTFYFWQVRSGVFSFNYVSQKWEHHTVGPLSQTLPWNIRPAIAGDLLCWSSSVDGQLHAIDLVNFRSLEPLSFNIPPIGPYVLPATMMPHILVYLGGNVLSLIALETGKNSQLHCLTFQIDRNSPTARIIPVSDANVDANGHNMPLPLGEMFFKISAVACLP